MNFKKIVLNDLRFFQSKLYKIKKLGLGIVN